MFVVNAAAFSPRLCAFRHIRALLFFLFPANFYPIKLVSEMFLAVITDESIVALSQARKWLFLNAEHKAFPPESALIDV